jgi:hypothetical protein
MTRFVYGTTRKHSAPRTARKSARKSAKKSAKKSARRTRKGSTKSAKRKQTGGNMISVLKTALLPFLFYKAQKTQQRRVIRKKQKTRKLSRRRR